MPTIITPDVRESQPFEITPGRQITLHAIGMQECDQVIVEVLGLTRAGPGGNWCCYNGPHQADITEAVPLRCRNGARVILTHAFPWATLNAPQSLPLRARVIADDLAQISVELEETESQPGCEICPCEEPYCASYPLPQGGFGFIEGDLRDCEATVDVAPCAGNGPVAWVYPTPRPGATAPVYDCAGNIVGYARNQSDCAIDTIPTVPCTRIEVRAGEELPPQP